MKVTRKIFIAGFLSLLITLMQLLGLSLSLSYGSSFYQSFFDNSTETIKIWHIILTGFVGWSVLSLIIYYLFQHLNERESSFSSASSSSAKKILIYCGLLLSLFWLFILIAIYPGFYNYDIGNQLPQFMYDEVPYNSHHPLLHTLISGSIISFGYSITNTLSFGVFLYNAFQLVILAWILCYSLSFIYSRTGNKLLVVFSFLFYALCPPIVLHAMSTTKDVLSYAFLLLGTVRLIILFDNIHSNVPVKTSELFVLGGSLLLSCLLRNNVIYAIALFFPMAILISKKSRSKLLYLYIGILLSYFMISNCLSICLNATPGSIGEALCVPYQQLACLYVEKGPSAFTHEELELLQQAIPLNAFSVYDPVFADPIKSNFGPGLPHILNNKWAYIALWIKKGFQFPCVYIKAFLFNTYQAWYPGTIIMNNARPCYFFAGTDWTQQGIYSLSQSMYEFFKTFETNRYADIPFLRLIYSIGTMFWTVICTWFFGFWKKDRTIICSLLLIILVCLTSFLGPVSLVRYYLILFYMFPICLSLFVSKK